MIQNLQLRWKWTKFLTIIYKVSKSSTMDIIHQERIIQLRYRFFRMIVFRKIGTTRSFKINQYFLLVFYFLWAFNPLRTPLNTFRNFNSNIFLNLRWSTIIISLIWTLSRKFTRILTIINLTDVMEAHRISVNKTDCIEQYLWFTSISKLSFCSRINWFNFDGIEKKFTFIRRFLQFWITQTSE